MKILPIVLAMRHDIASSGNRLKNATTAGYKIADRTAKIYNQNDIVKSLYITKSIYNNITKNVSKDDIPYIAGAIGAILPIPFITPIFLTAGFIIRLFFNTGSIREKLKAKHNNLTDNPYK